MRRVIKKYFILLILISLILSSCEKIQYNSVCEKNNSIEAFNKYTEITFDYYTRIAQCYTEIKTSFNNIDISDMNGVIEDLNERNLLFECPAYFGITKDKDVVTVIAPFRGSEPQNFESEINSFRGIDNVFDRLNGVIIYYNMDEANYIWPFDVYVDSVKQKKYKCDVIINEKYHSNDLNESGNNEEKEKRKKLLGEYTKKYDMEISNNKSIKSNEWNYFFVELPITDAQHTIDQTIDNISLNLNGEIVKLYHASEIMNMP